MASVSEALSTALDLHTRGRLADAETLYRRILRALPNQTDALHLLAALLAQTDRLSEGLTRIEQAIAIAPGNAAYHLNRATMCEAAGRMDDALISYGHALFHQPRRLESGLAEADARLVHLARALAEEALDAADVARASRLYRRALALAPDDVAACFDGAIALKRCGRAADAARPLWWTRRLRPDLERAHVEHAVILDGLDDTAGAADAFAEAATLNPLDPSHRWAVAVLRQRAGAPPQRVTAAYRPLLALDPAMAGGWANLCAVWRAEADSARAIEAGRRAATCAPTDAAAWVNLGAALQAEDGAKAAIAAARRGAALEPESPTPLINLAAAWSDAGAAAAAEPPLRHALRLVPGEPLALAQLGRVQAAMSRADAAVATLRPAIALTPTDAEGWACLSRAWLQTGDPARALIAARRGLRLAPGHPRGLLAQGMALEAVGDDVQALASYDHAIAAAPGMGTAFTRRALLLLRPSAPPPPPRPTPGGPRLSASQIGSAGRFGNQLLQYAVLRAHAEQQGLALETPDWIGRCLYGVDDPLPGPPLPPVLEEECGIAECLAEQGPDRCANREVVGYFCGDTTPLAPFRARVRNWFRPVGAVAAHANEVLIALRGRGRTLVAIHLRRGDFGGRRFWIAPEDWYLDWLDRVWPGLDRPVLCIATDAPDLIHRFARYAPLQTADLTAPLPGAEFFADHWVLSQADALAVSNSSFSVTAALLNDRARLMVRPHRPSGRLVPFDPWSGPVLWD